jgi:hypothetical protein
MKLILTCALILGLQAPDRLASEVQRCLALASDEKVGDEFTRPVRSGSLPALHQIEADLLGGRRLAALHRLVVQQINLGGAAYLDGLGAEQRDEAGFEKEWARVGALLAKSAPHQEALAALKVAALRAEAEANWPMASIMREAGLEYGRNTEVKFGLFYLGSALGARDFVELCSALDAPAGKQAPPLRSIRAELDALQAQLLAVYRPPVSVDRHAEFIGASSALKEARALDAAGQRHGAMLRYLTACARSAPLVDSAPAPSAEELVKLLDGFGKRIDGGAVDHSIAQVFLEYARSEIAAAPGTSPQVAVSIAKHSLPRYFAALEPAPAVAAAPKPEVDVTLVRWPYT